MYQPKIAGATLSDMADLAVRLGSIVEYDRRGDISLLDDFETPVVKWYRIKVIAAATSLLDFELPKSGSQCIKVTTGNTLDESDGIKRGGSLLGSPRLGQEISFAQPSDNVFLYSLLYWHDGTRIHRAGIKLSPNDGKLYYYNPDGGWSEIASGINIYDQPWVYNTIKFVVDFDTDKYVRLMLGSVEYDLSAYTMRNTASDIYPCFWIQVGIQNEASTGDSIWLDDYILTMNEP